MAEIRLEKLQKQYGDLTAVHNAEFTIRDGEFFVMLGPSGCGKTTTLRMIAGLEGPSRGKIYLDGHDITHLRGSQRDIAFVFQLFALYPHMNVRKNISFPLRVQGIPRQEIRERVCQVSQLLRIDHLLNQSVQNLSTGDRQRVALGRAIIRRAKAFLLDEPLGTLDSEFRDLMCKELRQLHEQIAATSVYVTHDQIEAMSMADRICIMHNGEVLQIGPPAEVYYRPTTKFVAGFIGSPSMNFLPAVGNIPAGSDQLKLGEATIKIPRLLENVDCAEVTLGIRPEHISLSNEGPLKGEVFAVEYMGTRQLITVDTLVGRLHLQAENSLRIHDGEQIALSVDQAHALLFDPKTHEAFHSDLFEEVLHV